MGSKLNASADDYMCYVKLHLNNCRLYDVMISSDSIV